jgi:hypothetical protein
MQVLLPRTCRNMHGLGCSAFARHYSRNHSCFLLLRLLRCFSSAGLPSLRNTLLLQGGLPHSDIRGSAPLAGPRGFSQLITSFFASGSLGIPRAPLFTYSLHIHAFCSVYMHSFCPHQSPDASLLCCILCSTCQGTFSRAVAENGNVKTKLRKTGLPERRCSSRTFRYGYLVTT